MANEKLYYSVYTLNEKIWIRADSCEIVDGCLAFYDIDEVTNAKVLITAFPRDYWRYMYEADVESGESIQQQIPFWKRHANKHDGQDARSPKYEGGQDTRPDNRPDLGYRKPHNPR